MRGKAIEIIGRVKWHPCADCRGVPPGCQTERDRNLGILECRGALPGQECQHPPQFVEVRLYNLATGEVAEDPTLVPAGLFPRGHGMLYDTAE